MGPTNYPIRCLTNRWTRGSIACSLTCFVDFSGAWWRSPASTLTLGGSLYRQVNIYG